MENNPEKSNLRKLLLEKRDATSFDLIQISSKQIHKKLKKIHSFRNAQNIAAYYPIGSEVKTQDIMQEILQQGKTLLLPKVVEDDLIFRKVTDMKNLEKGNFGILEPKDECPQSDQIDVILVPTVGITRKGVRLGYGHGFYDRFLKTSSAETIALTYSKQVVNSIPISDHDVKINWVVTEDEIFESSG